MPAGLLTPFQGVHLQKEAIVFGDPLLLVTSVSGLHAYRLRQTRK